MLQYQAFSNPRGRLEWARSVVAAKIRSQQAAARHYQRHGWSEAGSLLPLLQEALRQGQAADALDQLRGIEGAATAAWFGLLGRLVRAPWQFRQRTRRPPTDPVNALLSLGYTWLLTRATARCEAVGLEVYLGGLHDFRPGRPSLACDLIEPLRVPAVDRWMLTLCNQGRVAPADFRAEGGGIRLQPGAFGRILRDWEEHWQTGGLERALEKLLAELLRLVRQWPGPAASPSQMRDGTDL